jgi:hypothetical protein
MQYEILSSLGERVKTGTLNSNYTWFDLTLQAPGLYFIKVANTTYKILKTN